MSQATVSLAPQAASSKLRTFAGDIKISHTVFALPWAILATFLAAGGWPGWGRVGLIVGCMVCARTVAMAANRLLDAHLDKLNPRTARRAIPSGALSPRFYGLAAGACCVGFMFGCVGFLAFYGNPWPTYLGPLVLAFLSAYPLMKRFTRLCHYYLGLALALAPMCAWVAISGAVAWPPVVMAGAVLLWTAGFDIIYACQDWESDRQTGVFSVPAKIGVGRALWVARVTHLGCAALLVTIGFVTPLLGPIYYVGAAIAVALLVIEHALVRENDLSKVGLAFFTINGVISLLLGTLGVIDVFV
ncbi:MAG TPA: UbiA-like polyprenyltransferase [Tepidisphaeraceae bacterium]|nr:UbiA-like polyprenyltransferase [Tepidisphaeraceae bacterium]